MTLLISLASIALSLHFFLFETIRYQLSDLLAASDPRYTAHEEFWSFPASLKESIGLVFSGVADDRQRVRVDQIEAAAAECVFCIYLQLETTA